MATSAGAQSVVRSPDGRLALTFDTTGGRLAYSVAFQGQPVIDRSALALELKGEAAPLGGQVRVVNAEPSETDQTWRTVTGKTSSVRDHYRLLKLDVEETIAPNRRLTVEARAYNDAVAFRYVVPEQAGLRDFQLSRERTEFRISRDATSYALALPDFRSAYESEYLKLPLSSLATVPKIVGLPLLMELPGVAWMAITEADLRDTAAMYLANPSSGWGEDAHRLEARLAPRFDDATLAVIGTLPHRSAWRVLLVGDAPGRLIESNAILNMNPPAAIADTSWIRAGRAAWDWWSGSIGADGKPSYSTETMKYFTDFAAKSGLEFMLVDAGWAEKDDITRMNGKVDIPEVVRHAAAKNVKVWIWAHYKDVKRQREEAFALYERWGVAGVKIDFVERDDQEGMAIYYQAAEAAARHHLMLDFHGCTKPTGIERTWPNIMGYEAVMGMEWNKAGARDNPTHHVTLPFTRMLTGPMDYTPGGFGNTARSEFQARDTRPMVQGTRAHQLAMYAVYQSPFQMVSDSPDAYRDQPAFEFIKAAPATWDETRVLNGMPGEFITIARRHGTEWFLGAMTDWTARELDLPLTFLGSGKYRAEICQDSGAPKNVAITKQEVDRTTHLKAKMSEGGGYAVRFVKL
jgi:alpha-glucosidase